MSDSFAIADQAARIAAATTFDRNVVVIAGAGTGKTTLLVDRLMHLLMRRSDPLDLAQIVALTFTNKAATEMKGRLRERLRALANTKGRETTQTDSGTITLSDLRMQYGWTTDEIVARAQAALEVLERAQIGTLHSFAAHLLRLYPIEAGMAPNFHTDEDGSRFEEHFRREWDLWLDGELGPAGADHQTWRVVLDLFSLDELRAITFSLHGDLIDLEQLIGQVKETTLSPELREWFARRQAHTEELLSKHDRPTRRKIEQILAAVGDLCERLRSQGLDGLRGIPSETKDLLAKDLLPAPAGWTDAEAAEAERLHRMARRLLQVDHALLSQLLTLIAPFVQAVRKSFLNAGWLTFDGLLAKARALLRDHIAIREQLKRDYRALLVDEFQDTDPVQYEIVLYLAEQLGTQAVSWRDAELEPGKLFIVGDPKQSIYAFRRADIEAFEHVVERMERGGALRCELTTNFRSHAQIVDVVNGVFNELLVAQPAIQPPNVPLTVRPNRSCQFSHPGVELRLVTSEQDDDLNSAGATRVEAEQLALFLHRLLHPTQEALPSPGMDYPVRPGHIALLFRKLTHAEPYLEALRRLDIAYLIEGEKHFYRRQEVIDLVNLLRCVESPHDRIALAGLLRSAVGGLPDAALVALQEMNALDYRRVDRLSKWESPHAAPLRRLYEALARLHQDAPRCTLPEAVNLVFERLPVLELTAASLHGEQAVANLLKVRQMAADSADRPSLTLTAFVEMLAARLTEQPEEAESALAEDTLDAVRILTIHKAKGLEFPLVILAGLHHGDGPGHRSAHPLVWHDWATGVLGLDLGDYCSLGAVLAAEKTRVREQAERSRLFYVGMTRAREALVLSGAISRGRGRGTLLELLEQATGVQLGQPDQPEVSLGHVGLRQTILQAVDRPPSRPRVSSARLESVKLDETALKVRWAQRDHIWAARMKVPLLVSPSGFHEKPVTDMQSVGRSPIQSGHRQSVGTMVHRLLQYWRFDLDASAQLSRIDRQGLIFEAVEDTAEQEALVEEITDLLRTCIEYPWYERLKRATVVGREVPFVMPWNNGQQIMEGVIDLLYHLDGQLWIADYKTDMIPLDQVNARAETYREQARLYRMAVEQSLGSSIAGFEFVFLRHGLAVNLL